MKEEYLALDDAVTDGCFTDPNAAQPEIDMKGVVEFMRKNGMRPLTPEEQEQFIIKRPKQAAQ